MMKKAIILFLLCSFFSQSYSQFKLLEEAYKKKSEEQLKEFFVHWQKEIPSISNEEFESLSDIEKEVYNVFCIFYNPIELQTIGSSEQEDTIYQNVNYLVIQNSLHYRVQDKIFFTDEEKVAIYKKLLAKDGQKGIDSLKMQNIPSFAEEWVLEELVGNDWILNNTISNFRPPISLSNKNIVYLNSSYYTGLTKFLGSHIKKNESKTKYSYYLSKEEIKNRQLFLEQNIKVWGGHWGAYWLLSTFPSVDSIVFDKEIEYARVFFRIVYQGGEALLKKENGKWRLMSSKVTWTE